MSTNTVAEQYPMTLIKEPTVLGDKKLLSLRTYVHTKTCTWMFIAALLIIIRTWNQSRSPLGGE